MNKHRLHVVFLVLLLAVLLISVGSAGAAPGKGAVVRLSATQGEFKASQDVVVTVMISNPTKHSVRILNWFTPLNGVEEPIFFVKVNGAPVAYTGAVYKRPAASGADYIVLKAGQSLSYQVNLGEYYDLTASGEYELSYNAASYYLFSDKGNGFFGPASLTSEAIFVQVEGRTAKGKPPPPPPPLPGSNTFDACTVDQQATLVNARAQATTYASGSDSYLTANQSGTARYTEWFGIYNLTRFNTVANHFAALKDAWTNAGVTFHCGCRQRYYAYVYPDRPYEIWLCKVFWTAPLAGTDSQGGTLIHEMSHFNVVAGTDDYVYGQSGARSLADTNPDQAVMNADNHEYFAENNPYLP